jgi:Tfp pilus assembly protein PilF
MSARLDPSAVQTYAVTAYVLRKKMGKVDEAEQFLRRGWRTNPDSYVLLLELGRLYREDKQDTTRARNVLELGLQKWREQQSHLDEPDIFPYQQFLVQLARIEEQAGNIPQAIAYLTSLAKHSPDPEIIHRQITELEARIAEPTDQAPENHSPASKEQSGQRTL